MKISNPPVEKLCKIYLLKFLFWCWDSIYMYIEVGLHFHDKSKLDSYSAGRIRDIFTFIAAFFIWQEYAKVLQKREEDRLAKKHQDLLEQKAAPQPVSFIFVF